MCNKGVDYNLIYPNICAIRKSRSTQRVRKKILELSRLSQKPISKLTNDKKAVIPAPDYDSRGQAATGIQTSTKILDSRLHGNDKIETRGQGDGF